MAGMTVASLKHHIALQPLFVIMGVGLVFVGAYCFRYRKTKSSNHSPNIFSIATLGSILHSQLS